MILGQLARPLAPGQGEVALSAGAELQLAPSPFPGTSGNKQVDLPAAQGRVAYGISKNVELALEASEVGLAPGVKLSRNFGELSVALLPEVAIGFVSGTPSVGPPGGFGDFSLAAQPDKNLNLMPGFRVLFSRDTGIYGGLGYDYLRRTSAFDVGDAITGSSGFETTAHYLTAAIGYSTQGTLIVRPELSVLFCPAQTTSFNEAFAPEPPSTSFWAILPNITFAVRSSEPAPPAMAVPTVGGDERLQPPPLVH